MASANARLSPRGMATALFLRVLFKDPCQTPRRQMRLLGLIATLTLAYAQKKVVVGYYVPWGKVAPSALPYDKVTHINYGFGVMTKHNDPANIFVDRYYDGNKIRELTKLAKKKRVKTLISVGGWTGSQTFSLVVRSRALRKKLIKNLLVFVSKNTKPDYDEKPNGWDFDGIDLDWEYPGRKAAKCNVYSPKDSQHYLVFLKELRAALDKRFGKGRKLLTAAVRVQPFDGADGKPMKNVKAYAKYFDFVNIMTYDIMGSWSNTTGANAPFRADTRKSGDPYSFTQGINDWLKAGFPASKLTAGLAFYGRTLTATVDMNQNPANMYQPKEKDTPKGDSSDANEANAFCNEGTFYSGVYKYKFLRQDALRTPYTAKNGFTRHWDKVTQTPWLFHAQTKRFISYDDPKSLKIKVDYARKKNLRGVMYWDMSHDHNNELLNVATTIRKRRPAKKSRKEPRILPERAPRNTDQRKTVPL